MDRTWRVVFRGRASLEELAALPSERMVHVSGHDVGGRLESSTVWVRAADAAAAEEAVRSALSAPGTVLPAELLPYLVSIEVPEADAGTLDRALSRLRRETGRIGGLITTSPDGIAELLLDADAESDEDAIELVAEDYLDLRHEAGLGPADLGRHTVYPPWSGEQPSSQRRHYVLLDRARKLHGQGVPGLAVVVAQSGVEVLVRQVISERLLAREIGALREYIIGGIRTHTLNDDRTRKLWLELTGDEIDRSAAWEEYKLHLKRRHAIVHLGDDVSPDEAGASVAAARALIEHIESLPPI